MRETNTEKHLWARESERPFLRRVVDLLDKVHAEQRFVLTDFLTPREFTLLENIVRSNGCVVASYGGTAYSERVRALLMPDEWYPVESDFQVGIVKVMASEQDILSHGNILGSVLGLGLDRKKIGDIVFIDNIAYVMITLEVVKFLQAEWHHVGRASISTEFVEGPLDVEAPTFEEASISLASLRLDALIAQSCHLSRTRAQEAIVKGNISLNFVVHNKPDETIEVGDVVSFRGFGRIKVLEMQGKSKSDRFRVRVGMIRSRKR